MTQSQTFKGRESQSTPTHNPSDSHSITLTLHPFFQVHGHHSPPEAADDGHGDHRGDRRDLGAGPPPGLPPVLLLRPQLLPPASGLLHRLARRHREDVSYVPFALGSTVDIIQSLQLVYEKILRVVQWKIAQGAAFKCPSHVKHMNAPSAISLHDVILSTHLAFTLAEFDFGNMGGRVALSH